MTDLELLADVVHPDDKEWVGRPEPTYIFYSDVGSFVADECPGQPVISILEMGVRYGYSAVAMIQGIQARRKNAHYIGIDVELDGVPSNDIAGGNIMMYAQSWDIYKVHTSDFMEIVHAMDSRKFDIVHVDGDHSVDGILNELGIALAYVKPSGFILVDDLDTPHVKAATLDLCEKLGIKPDLIPTYHGMHLIDMSERRKDG